jgi:hypothetical protein
MKLQDITAATFSFESLVEFLCSAAFPESKYTDINRSLLKQALQSSGNVTVLTDGFDEISPTHVDKAAAILSELMKTKVRRLWVTSRPVMKERLEKEFGVPAFTLKELPEMIHNIITEEMTSCVTGAASINHTRLPQEVTKNIMQTEKHKYRIYNRPSKRLNRQKNAPKIQPGKYLPIITRTKIQERTKAIPHKHLSIHN